MSASVRASYREAVEWIANNDNAGNGDTVEEIAEYISTALISDLWRKDALDVARDVARKRGDVPGFAHRRNMVLP
jgi:hypothetical protein